MWYLRCKNKAFISFIQKKLPFLSSIDKSYSSWEQYCIPFSATTLLCLIGATILAVRELGHLALEQIAAQWRYSVGKDLTLQVVVLVLDNACWQTIEQLIVLNEVLIQIAHLDSHRATHILVQTWQRQATLVKEVCFLRYLINLGIDKDLLIVSQRWIILTPRGAIDDEQTDILTNLWSSQTNARSLVQSEEHIVNELLQIGIIGSDIHRLVTQSLDP